MDCLQAEKWANLPLEVTSYLKQPQPSLY